MAHQQQKQFKNQKQAQDEYYVLEYKEVPSDWCKSPKQSLLAMIFAVFLIIALPCMIIGNAKVYYKTIKYKDTKVTTCYGGQEITEYQILPQIYNSTLTYFPARLEFLTREVGTNRTVRMTYPTYFERTFADNCVFHNDKSGRNPCDKLVGDVITKYNELVAVTEFPCYIVDQQIIGLAGEQSVIRKYYRLSTVGIVFIVLDIVIVAYALGDSLGLGLP